MRLHPSQIALLALVVLGPIAIGIHSVQEAHQAHSELVEVRRQRDELHEAAMGMLDRYDAGWRDRKDAKPAPAILERDAGAGVIGFVATDDANQTFTESDLAQLRSVEARQYLTDAERAAMRFAVRYFEHQFAPK